MNFLNIADLFFPTTRQYEVMLSSSIKMISHFDYVWDDKKKQKKYIKENARLMR